MSTDASSTTVGSREACYAARDAYYTCMGTCALPLLPAYR